MPEPRVLLDTSAFFAAVLSEGGGSRALVRRGELGAVSLWVGLSMLQKADEVFRRKANDLRPPLAALLSRPNIGRSPVRL